MIKSKYRFLLVLLVGVIIFYILEFFMEDFGANPNRNRLYDLVGTIGITFLIWGGNLQIDKFLNKKIGWEGNYLKRISIQLSVTLVYSFLIIYFAMDLMNTFLCEVSAQREKFLLKSAIIVGLLVTLVILSIEVGVQFFYQWKKTLVEVENYKIENIQSQLQNLKNQMNPHFLFNNLSVLTSLVYQDQDKAVDFIQQLSKVYRYILENKNNELVTVEEEMNFLDSYFFLLKIRFGDNILFDISIDNEDKKCFLPPYSLQTLVENVIKHNEISTQKPLTIHIQSNGSIMKICNTLQLRMDSQESSKTGLENLKKRYSFLTDQNVLVRKTNNEFCVEIPLIQAK